MLPPFSPVSPLGPAGPVSPFSPLAPVAPVAPVAPSLPSLPFLPSFTIVVVTVPVSRSVIVIVWVPSLLFTTSPVMLPPFSPFSPVSPLGPAGPVSPFSPLGPVAPVAPVEPPPITLRVYSLEPFEVIFRPSPAINFRGLLAEFGLYVNVPTAGELPLPS